MQRNSVDLRTNGLISVDEAYNAYFAKAPFSIIKYHTDSIVHSPRVPVNVHRQSSIARPLTPAPIGFGTDTLPCQEQSSHHSSEQAKHPHDVRGSGCTRPYHSQLPGQPVHAHIRDLKVGGVVVRRRPEDKILVANAGARLLEDCIVSGKVCKEAT